MTPNHLRTAHKPARLGPAPVLRSERPASSTPRPLAVLLYEDWSSSYSRSLNQQKIKYSLTVERHLVAHTVRAQQILYLCPPQRRYTDRRQCEHMLQSEAVQGVKEFLTGLRDVPVPQGFSPVGVRLFVGDYKPDRYGKGPANTTVVLEGPPEGTRPGWLLVLVMDKPYRRRNARINAETAKATALAVLPQLPEWLAKLPLEELQAA